MRADATLIGMLIVGATVFIAVVVRAIAELYLMNREEKLLGWNCRDCRRFDTCSKCAEMKKRNGYPRYKSAYICRRFRATKEARRGE